MAKSKQRTAFAKKCIAVDLQRNNQNFSMNGQNWKAYTQHIRQNYKTFLYIQLDWKLQMEDEIKWMNEQMNEWMLEHKGAITARPCARFWEVPRRKPEWRLQEFWEGILRRHNPVPTESQAFVFRQHTCCKETESTRVIVCFPNNWHLSKLLANQLCF